MPEIEWRNALKQWYANEKRDLPWRKTSDPYAIWVSEVMLQQTQVATVLPFYERWMARFPSVEALATAQEEEVLAHWAGLGYYSRARNLHSAAKAMALDGVPEDHLGWLRVRGVGPYTAGAVASIALGEAVPVVDGNVERVFARLTARDLSGSALKRAAWAWAEESLDQDHPGDWNQALMELGATICTPRNPSCLLCPCLDECRARDQGLENTLPRSVPRRKPVELQLHYGVVERQGLFAIERIPVGNWWAGLWSFVKLDKAAGQPALSFNHVVTHHRIRVHAYHLTHWVGEAEWVPFDELRKRPMPTPQSKIRSKLVASLAADNASA